MRPPIFNYTSSTLRGGGGGGGGGGQPGTPFHLKLRLEEPCTVMGLEQRAVKHRRAPIAWGLEDEETERGRERESRWGP